MVKVPTKITAIVSQSWLDVNFYIVRCLGIEQSIFKTPNRFNFKILIKFFFRDDNDDDDDDNDDDLAHYDSGSEDQVKLLTWEQFRLG